MQGDIDIKTAFLQGDSLKREIFVKQLPEAQCDFSILWKLNKCVYGLTDASLMWYNRIIKFVTTCNSKVSKIDPALFLWHKNMNLEGFIIVQVDDFLWAGTENFKQTVISQLKETFHIGKIENTIFNFLGLKLNQINEGITVDQYDYTRSLEMIKIDPSRKRDLNQPLTLIETDLLQSKIGHLLWINNQTCPDIGFEVCQIASNLKNPTTEDLIFVNKIIKRLCETQYHLTYRPTTEDHKIVLSTDASFGNLPNGGSQGAHLIHLVGDDNTCNLISWQFKRIKRIAKSSLTSETLALSEGVNSAYYISTLFAEIMYGNIDNHKLTIEAYSYK